MTQSFSNVLKFKKNEDFEKLAISFTINYVWKKIFERHPFKVI